MNVQEYISSGIVESYILGLASREERSEFEKMCELHPEVLQARTAFELALENQAMQNAISPPAALKDKILSQLDSPSSGKIVSMLSTPVKSINPIAIGWLKYAATACVLLLAGSLYWNISLYNKNKHLQNNYSATVAKLNDMENAARILQQNPNVKMTAMTGLEVSPQSFATVYWDTTSHDVYLLANNLPIPASDKQYQLWAIFNGKPVDLGVFDIKKEKLLIQARNAQGAQAFAITLEKKGGSPSPQGAMYVMGKL